MTLPHRRMAAGLAGVGRLIPLKDAAELLAVSKRTIQAWVAVGRLTPYRLARRTLRVSLAEVEGIVRESATVPASPRKNPLQSDTE